MTPPSRGSALYAATLVTIGAAAGVRFFTATADAVPTAAGGPSAAPATVTTAPSSSPTASGSSLSWDRGPHGTPTAAPTPTAPVPTAHPAPTATHSTSTPTPKPAAPAAPAPAAPAAPVTKVVVGSVVQTRYGPVQVQVTFAGGVITAAQALQSPSGGYSSQVSSFSLPVLSGEAVAASSASIASVSGATFTSAGYRQSLQYAIDHKG